MAATERLPAQFETLHSAIPRQRRASQQEQIDDDDRLIEAVRSGRITDDHEDPVARMLCRWRAYIIADRG